MRVGVYIGDFAPEEGGAHSFVSAVLGGFLPLAASSRHAFTMFCEPGQLSAARALGAAYGVPVQPLAPRTAVSMAGEAMRHYSPLSWLLRHRSGRLERAARSAAIDLLWFVPGLAYEAPDIPYIGTIWDLQHRLLPWFPEASHHGYWEHRELVYARFTRRAMHVVTGTRVGAEQLCRLYGIDAARVSVLPQPAPRPAQAPAPSAQVAGLMREPYVLYPAQFWAHKNHVNLLHGLKDLELRHGLRVAAVFPGADKGNLEHVRRVCEALGLAARVHFPGFVSGQDLAALYAGAVALAYPSFNGPDNLPPLEAFAAGCPVALADYPGAAEQTADAALRFNPCVPGAIADALHALVTDAGLRAQLVERGRARAAAWGAEDYGRGVLALIDRFEPMRRCWP